MSGFGMEPEDERQDPRCKVTIERTASNKVTRKIAGTSEADEELVTQTVNRMVRGFYELDRLINEHEGGAA